MKRFGREYDRLKHGLGYPFRLLRTNARLVAESETLRVEAEELRGRLIAAQQARVQAQNQSEELRKEKERLRARLAEAKSEVESLKGIKVQLGERIAELTAELSSVSLADLPSENEFD